MSEFSRRKRENDYLAHIVRHVDEFYVTVSLCGIDGASHQWAECEESPLCGVCRELFEDERKSCPARSAD